MASDWLIANLGTVNCGSGKTSSIGKRLTFGCGLWLKNIPCLSSLVVDGDYQNDDGGSNTRTIMIMIKRKLIMMTMKTGMYIII